MLVLKIQECLTDFMVKNKVTAEMYLIHMPSFVSNLLCQWDSDFAHLNSRMFLLRGGGDIWSIFQNLQSKCVSFCIQCKVNLKDFRFGKNTTVKQFFSFLLWWHNELAKHFYFPHVILFCYSFVLAFEWLETESEAVGASADGDILLMTAVNVLAVIYAFRFVLSHI